MKRETDQERPETERLTATENAAAETVAEGDRLHYRGLDVTVTGPREDDPNQFGLPWFRFPVRADDGRTGYAKFGPGGHVARYIPREDGCACAVNSDRSTTTMLCSIHADTDPCLTVAQVTGKRRKGTIRSGRCTACGWTETRP
ncbi:hypothetical protein ACFVAJ_18020 [Agromyces sp. NPDC057679]|uniref:hypothetical protein n=1 Tax=Agromyces sp. NPDC057679 TaxID=3346207 RepID=UPI00366B33DD